jgi:hypothetical protein
MYRILTENKNADQVKAALVRLGLDYKGRRQVG